MAAERSSASASRNLAVQQSASTSEDDEGEARKPEYLIPVLQQEPSPGGSAAAAEGAISLTTTTRNNYSTSRTVNNATENDDESNYFLSEPSVSEDGDSQYKVRAPHQTGLLGSSLQLWQPSRGGEDDDRRHRKRGAFLSSSDDDDDDEAVPSDDGDNARGGGGGGVSTPVQSGDDMQHQQEHQHQQLEERQGVVCRTPENDGDNRRSHQRQRQRQAYAATMSPGNTSLSSWENSPAVNNKKVLLQFVMPESKFAMQTRLQQQQQRQQQQQPQAARANVRFDSGNTNGPTVRDVGRHSHSRSVGSSGGGAVMFPSLEQFDRRYQQRGGVAVPTALPQMRQEPSNSHSVLHQQNYLQERRQHSQRSSRSNSLPANNNFFQNVPTSSESVLHPQEYQHERSQRSHRSSRSNSLPANNDFFQNVPSSSQPVPRPLEYQQERRQQSQHSSRSNSLPSNNNFFQNFRNLWSKGSARDPSTLLTPPVSDESRLRRQHGADRAEAGSVMRHNRGHPPTGDRNENARRNLGKRGHDDNEKGDFFPMSPMFHSLNQHSIDESVAMTLSDSEGGDAVDDSLQSDRPLDWEAHHSADDEKTVKRPVRIVRMKTAPGHRRSRSGDDAAATLVTGRKDWKGMEQDRIPFPVGDGDDDEESGLPPNISAIRRPRRYARPPHGGRAGGVVQVGPPSAQDVSSTEIERSQEKGSMSVPIGNSNKRVFWSPAGRNEKGDSRQAWINQMAQLHQKQTLDQSVNSQNSGQGSMQESSRGSLQSLEEETPEEQSEGEDSAGTSASGGEAQVSLNRIPLNFSDTLDQMEHDHEAQGLRGTPHTVLRPLQSQSPFANIGKKSAERAPRSTFLPATYQVDDPNYPTFICPRCKSRQREFFTVDNAAGRLEGPGSYLALYFAIYVICSLFIFGLEEGWMPLDCIYFAVITLTTAGLGDFVPTSNANKIICSIFIYFGVACIGLLLGSYIAGMLDDKASQDRKEKQIDACPTCARIKTMKEAAARRSAEALDASFASRLPRRHMSARASGDTPAHIASAVLTPHHHRHPLLYSNNDHRHISSHGSVDDTGPASGPDFSAHGSSSPATSNASVNSHLLGSPLTRQFLGRQSHTRHASIDINGKNFLAGGMPRTYGTAPVRKFSEEMPSQTPTKDSGLPESNGSTAKKLRPIASSENLFDGFTDCDDESSVISTSTVSSTEELWDSTKSQIQAAKYVFLTLRLALINSLVIIAVGCVGFWAIEGFSLVDSWYFTTVLLTTVGYGDIVPVTDGGKLFATIYILVAGTILLNNMSSISMIPLELRRRRIERAILTQFGDHLDDAALRELATGPVIQRLRLSANRTDGLDECTREMFALAMLVRLGKVTEQDIRETFASFRHLDVNNEGVLNSKSIIAGMIAKQRSMNTAANNNNNNNQPPPPPPPVAAPVVEQEKDMRRYWFGRQGSLHVSTAESAYHFNDSRTNVNERSSLLGPGTLEDPGEEGGVWLS